MQQAAQAEGVTPATTPNATAAAQNAQLQGLTGSAFIKQYLQDERQSNIQGITYLEQEITNGADPALVALAQAALPLQQQHLAAAVQASNVLNAGLSDTAGAPSTSAGQTAASLGTSVAQQAVTTGQELAAASGSSSGLLSTTPGSGTSSLGTLASGSSTTANFLVTDVTTGATTQAAGSATSGAVSYLQSQHIYAGTDNASIIAGAGNVFIKGGAGQDALVANSGSNVLDGGGGSNYLVGASGADGGVDTFFINGTGGQNTWSTIVNFHVGDTLTLFGFNPAAGTTSLVDNQGATGSLGETLRANFGDGTGAATLVTFAGLTSGASTLVTTTGTTGGQSYLAVVRTA